MEPSLSMKQEKQSSTLPGESKNRSGSGDDPIVEQMKVSGLDETRRNYLALNWGNRDYDPSPEEESLMPERFRRK